MKSIAVVSPTCIVHSMFTHCMSLQVYILIYFEMSSCSAQAPGDADFRCTDGHERPPVYPDNVRMLMDSNHYEALLPGNGTGNPPREGAVWNDRGFDGNDVADTVVPTYVSTCFR